MQFLYYLQQQWTGSEPQSIHFFRRPLTCKALNQYLRVVKPESVPCHWATGGWGREVQQQRGARTYCGTSLKLPSNSYSSSAGDSRVDRTVPPGPTAFLSTYSMFRTPKLARTILRVDVYVPCVLTVVYLTKLMKVSSEIERGNTIVVMLSVPSQFLISSMLEV